jgi:prepilin-type N-terminal cleavage/methylation domain-containing protein
MIGRAGARERGLTLVEVLVSIGIAAICIPALLAAIIFGFGILKLNAHKATALALARRKMENIMNIRYDSISTAANAYRETNVPIDSAGAIKATINAAVTNPSGTSRKNIAVTVQWAEQGRNHSVSLHTLVSKNNIK